MINNADNILKLAESYYDYCNHMVIIAKIRKLPNGKYRVLSEKGKNLGTYKTRDGAKKRLRQVEYFKHVKASDNNLKEVNFESLKDFSLSAILRHLNKKNTKKEFLTFLNLYKQCFDELIRQNCNDPDEIALKLAYILFCQKFDVKSNEEIVVTAQQANFLGDAISVGRYLSEIVKFILNRISPENRQKSINKVKTKLYYLNENEIALKKMPASSSLGQSITFVKTVLFNQQPKYIRDVLNNIVRNL
jgi:hypothetical protein